MQTAIGKKFRSRKVKLAYEKRLLKQKEEDSVIKRNELRRKENSDVNGLNTNPRTHETATLLNNSSNNEGTYNETNVNNAGGAPSNLNGGNNKKVFEQTNYDTVTSVHDIEQDAHVYYYSDPKFMGQDNFNSRLPNIAEVPTKAITRCNSVNDNTDVK